MTITPGNNKKKRPTPMGTAQGRSTLIKNPMRSAQGRSTFTTLIGCAILGMVLSKALPFVIGKLRPTMSAAAAEEAGVLIALGISGGLAIIRLLKPKESLSPLRKQLLKVQENALKEQEKSDGK